MGRVTKLETSLWHSQSSEIFTNPGSAPHPLPHPCTSPRLASFFPNLGRCQLPSQQWCWCTEHTTECYQQLLQEMLMINHLYIKLLPFNSYITCPCLKEILPDFHRHSLRQKLGNFLCKSLSSNYLNTLQARGSLSQIFNSATFSIHVSIDNT